MAQRNKDAAFRAVLDRFARDLIDVLTAHVDEQVAAAVSRLRPAANGHAAKTDGRRSGRLCPVAGCGEIGAGPRNRWFWREHARKVASGEQKRKLEGNRRLGSEGKLPTAIASQQIVR